jgi:cell division septation protein DedD
LAQDDYYYEIQLTNKQLVFYFMAGASFLVLSFLAGIVVGRGVDAQADTTPMARLAQEDKLVAEEAPAATTRNTPSPVDLTYSPRLEADKLEHRLEKPKSGEAKPAVQEADLSAREAPAMIAEPPKASRDGGVKNAATSKPAGAAGKPAPVVASSRGGAAAGAFAIQVGAFKDKASATSIVGRLKSKGYAAYVIAPEGAGGGLFNVRVGSFADRERAEKVEAKLRDEEKFKPFIVKQ